jgi:hypothetical protein
MPDVLFGVVAVPAITGLVEASKQAGFPSRFAALLAVLFGVGLAAVWQWSQAGPNYAEALIVGIGFGLAAAGLYSGAQAVRSPPPPTT